MINCSMDQLIEGPVEVRESYRVCVYEIDSEDCDTVLTIGITDQSDYSTCLLNQNFQPVSMENIFQL